MKLAGLYFSLSGHTKQMAEEIVSGMTEVPGVEAKAFSITDFDASFVQESAAVVLGTPVYMASMAHQMHSFLQTTARQSGIPGKLCGAFATEDYVHGGGEAAIEEILKYCLVMGCLTYSGGGAFGVPIIHLGPVAVSDDLSKYAPTFRTYGTRMAQTAKKLFGQ